MLNCTPKGTTASDLLFNAAYHGHLDQASEVLSLDESVALSLDAHDRTPLHYAAIHGEAGMLRLLLEAKADVCAPDRYGTTPLHCAVYHGHESLIRKLLVARANAHSRDANGRKPQDLTRNAAHISVIASFAKAAPPVSNKCFLM